MAVLIIGNKEADTSSCICSIAIADFMNKRGIEATPAAAKAPGAQAAHIIAAFGLHSPLLISSIAGQRVVLVGHSSLENALEGITEAEVIGVVDKNDLGDIPKDGLEAWIRPMGSIATVVKSMYDAQGMEISTAIAGGLLGALLYETDVLRSAIVTREDLSAAVALAKIAGVESYQSFGEKIIELG